MTFVITWAELFVLMSRASIKYTVWIIPETGLVCNTRCFIIFLWALVGITEFIFPKTFHIYITFLWSCVNWANIGWAWVWLPFAFFLSLTCVLNGMNLACVFKTISPTPKAWWFKITCCFRRWMNKTRISNAHKFWRFPKTCWILVTIIIWIQSAFVMSTLSCSQWVPEAVLSVLALLICRVGLASITLTIFGVPIALAIFWA